MNMITRLLVSGLLLIPALLLAQSPVAHFSASNTAVCDNVYNENFTDLSSNKPTHWKWYFPGATPDTSTLQNPTNIQYKGYGRYTVKLVVQNNNGSDSLTDSNYICLDAPPHITLTGRRTACSDEPKLDTLTAYGGTRYLWMNGDTTPSCIFDPFVYFNVEVIVYNGACSKDSSFDMVYDSSPHFRFAGDTSICVGNNTTIYALYIKPYGNYEYTYLWSTGSTTDSIIVNGIKAGTNTYTLIVSKRSCHDTSQITVGVHDCTGIENYDDPLVEVVVYPNPNNGKFSLTLSNENEKCNIEIYNVLGENIYQSKINSNNTAINLSGQSNGVYLYRVITETGELIGEGKVVVER